MKLNKIFIAFFAMAILGALSVGAAAQTTFTGTLNSAQEVPTNASTAVGFGRVTLNAAETQITYSLTFSGLGSNQAASHIHGPAAAGANAAVIFNIGSTGATSGTFTALTSAVTAAQVADLKAGLWYFNIHSATFGGGEIRAQILPDPAFVGTLNSRQEVPANASAGTGFGTVSLNKTETQIVASMNYTGLGSTQTAAHIHAAALPGVNAAVLFNFGAPGGTSGSFTDLFFNVNPAQVADLKAGKLYFNVHTTALPGGEIRAQIKPPNKFVDFTGDGRADIAVFRALNGAWFRLDSENNSFNAAQWGQNNDVITPADFDGDARTDLAVWRQNGGPGTFYILQSGTNTLRAQQWGQLGDNPAVSADYDGDGKADIAVFRTGASTGLPSFYYYVSSLTGAFRQIQWGQSGDSSIVGDFDGDRISDFTVYRQITGTYLVLRSSNGGFQSQQWGNFASDAILTGDYDGDGRTDYGVFRFSGAGAGNWYLNQSTAGISTVNFGLGSDTAVPADFDGDGKTDIAVYRRPIGTWYYLRSSDGAFTSVPFGSANDVPLPVYLTR